MGPVQDEYHDTLERMEPQQVCQSYLSTCPQESFWEALLLRIIIMVIVSILPIVLFGPRLGSSLSTPYCKNSTRNLKMRFSGGDSPTKTISGVRSRYVFYIINCHVYSPKSSVRDWKHSLSKHDVLSTSSPSGPRTFSSLSRWPQQPPRWRRMNWRIVAVPLSRVSRNTSVWQRQSATTWDFKNGIVFHWHAFLHTKDP